MRGEVTLNSIRFPLAKGKQGQWLWSEGSRASQPGDPGGVGFADWRVDGPDLTSTETPNGYLGRDYGLNTDGRWEGYDTLGPLINTVTLSTYDQFHNVTVADGTATLDGSFFLDGAVTVSNTDAIATIVASGSSTQFAYLARGSGYSLAKTNLTSMAVQQTGLATNTVVTDVISTTPESRTAIQEVSVALGDSDAYQTVQAGGVQTTNIIDTWAANSSSQAARIFGQAPDRAVALYSNAGLPTVKGNVMTGSVTMAAPSWATTTTITSQPVTFTGFSTDGDLWVLGTNYGPFMLDPNTLTFFNMLPETTANTENLRKMQTWFPVGVVMPFVDSLRQQRFGQGVSFGPENFGRNSSPVSGYVTAIATSQRWLYTAIYNAQTTDTYLVAWRPPKPGEQPGHLLVGHTLAKFTALQCRAMLNVGRANGNRANDTLIGGYGSNMFWITIGRTSREIDDANYLNALSGTTYLTEHHTHGVLADIEAVEYETDNHTANRTSQVAVQINNSGSYVNLGSAVTANGFQRALAVSSGAPLTTLQGATRIKPSITYSSNVSTSAPRVYGNLRVYWRWRPLLVKDYQFTLEVNDETSGSARTAPELEAALTTAWTSAPVLFQPPTSVTPNTATYVRVNSVKAVLVSDSGGDTTSSKGLTFNVEVAATQWQLT